MWKQGNLSEFFVIVNKKILKKIRQLHLLGIQRLVRFSQEPLYFILSDSIQKVLYSISWNKILFKQILTSQEDFLEEPDVLFLLQHLLLLHGQQAFHQVFGKYPEEKLIGHFPPFELILLQ